MHLQFGYKYVIVVFLKLNLETIKRNMLFSSDIIEVGASQKCDCRKPFVHFYFAVIYYSYAETA